MNLKLKKLVFSLIAFALIFTFVGCESAEDRILKSATEKIIVVSNITNLTSDFNLQSKVTVIDEEEQIDLDVVWSITQSPNVVISTTKDEDGLYKATVTQPAAGSDQVELKLTATVTYNKKSASRVWDVYVKPLPVAKVVDTVGAKEALINDYIEVSGTISAIIPKAGFIVSDDKGGFYVYMGGELAENIKLGAEIKATGRRAVYYSMPQMTSPSVVVTKEAPAAGYDYTNAATKEISEIANGSPDVKANYGVMNKIAGVVVANPNKTPVEYSILDLKSYTFVHFYDNAANDDIKKILADKVGKYVELVSTTYDFNSSLRIWRALGAADTVVEATAPVLTNADKVASAKNEIIAKLYKKEVVDNLTLFNTSTSGATVAWVSSVPATITNTGKLTSPDKDTKVKLSATITMEGITETLEVEVTAKYVPVQTILKIVNDMDKAADKTVAFEGVLIARDKSDYLFFADQTGYIYVRSKDASLSIGDKVKVVGKTTVYLNSNKEYTRQMTIISSSKLEGQNHSNPLTAQSINIADFQQIHKESPLTADEITLIKGNGAYNKKYVSITGKVVVQGSFNNAYLEDANGKQILINYNSEVAKYDALKALAGQTVTIEGVIYNYSASNLWNVHLVRIVPAA